jgi:hypothetical protein
MRHIKALSKKSSPALAGLVSTSCLSYLLAGDLSTFKECKASSKDTV